MRGEKNKMRTSKDFMYALHERCPNHKNSWEIVRSLHEHTQEAPAWEEKEPGRGRIAVPYML